MSIKVKVLANQNGTQVLDPSCLSATAGYEIGGNHISTPGGSRYCRQTSDDDQIFNVTDPITVQDAYLASIKMGHFNGSDEHSSGAVTPESARRGSRVGSADVSPLKLRNVSSPGIRRSLYGDDEDLDITHGSDNEGNKYIICLMVYSLLT